MAQQPDLLLEPPSAPLRRRGMVMVLIAATLWGLSGTAAQVLFQHDHFTTAWLVSVRMLFSGVVLVVWRIFRQPTKTQALLTTPQLWPRLILFAVVGLFGVQFTYFKAIAQGTAASATLLQYLGPPMIVAYLAISTRRFPGRTATVAIILAFGGTMLLVTGGHFNRLQVPIMAVVWGILSALALVFYTLQPLFLIHRYGAIALVGWGMLVGGIASLAFEPIWRLPPTLFTPSAFLLTFFVVVPGTLAAFTLYLASLSYLKPSETGLLATAEPVSAVTASMLFLHVHLDLGQIIGAACIVLAIIWLSQRRES